MELSILRKVIASFLSEVDFSGESIAEVADIKEALEPLVSHYQNIIGYIPANVYWFDEHCIAMGCNQNVLNMFGLKSVEQFKGMSFEEMGVVGHWTAETMQSFKQDTLEVIKTGKAKLNIEEPPIPHAEGRLIYFLSNRVPLRDKNKRIIGAVGISVDITEQKQNQQALAAAKEAAESANKAKTEFLQNMSHELRTPLNGILGMTEVLSYSPRLNEEDKEKISSLRASGEVLLKLINDILNFAKIESKQTSFESLEVNFSELMRELIHSFLPAAKQKNLALECYYADDCPTHIVIAPLCVRQILSNFIDNAIKFTNAGSVTVFVDIQKKAGDQALLHITVKDTGVGISKQQLPHVFERFYQVNPSYTKVSSGVGLGLAIAKELANEMGGSITVDSEVGKGSTFAFTLPCKLPAEHQAQALHQDVHKTSLISHEKNEKPLRILLVEDSPINQKIIDHMLSLLCNCSIEIADTGSKAIDAFNKDFDLVLLDIGLPDISGFEVAEQLNALMAAEKFSVPLVSVTAHADVTTAHPLYSQLNFTGALVKPIHMQSLKDLISQILAEKKLQ